MACLRTERRRGWYSRVGKGKSNRISEEERQYRVLGEDFGFFTLGETGNSWKIEQRNGGVVLTLVALWKSHYKGTSVEAETQEAIPPGGLDQEVVKQSDLG